MNGTEQLQKVMKNELGMNDTSIASCIGQLEVILNINKIIKISIISQSDKTLEFFTSDDLHGILRLNDNDITLSIR